MGQLLRHIRPRRNFSARCVVESLEARFLPASIVDLGLGRANAINDAGEVVGYTITASNKKHAFIYTEGVVNDLGTLGGLESVANDVNASGQIVGWADMSNGTQRPFIFTDKMQPISTLASPTANSASSINDNGKIALNGNPSVIYSTGPEAAVPLKYTLPGFPNQLFTAGVSIKALNNSSVAVGQASLHGAGGWPDAFMYTPSPLTSIILPVPGTTSVGYPSTANDINNFGWIVGSDNQRAFVSHDGQLYSIGTLPGDSASYADGIDDSEDVVGASGHDGVYHAFIYTNGKMVDLNSLLPANSGWILTEATAINNQGQIVGTGIRAGVGHAFLLNLKEPSDIVIDSATYNDQSANSVTFAYHTVQTPGTFIVGLYLSSDQTFDPSDVLLGSTDVTPMPNTSAIGTIQLNYTLTIPQAKPYLLIVADPSNLVIESHENNNSVWIPRLITLQQLRKFMPALPLVNAINYIDPLNRAMVEFQINTPKREASFLAQLKVESKSLTAWTEAGQPDIDSDGHPNLRQGRGPIQLTNELTFAQYILSSSTGQPYLIGGQAIYWYQTAYYKAGVYFGQDFIHHPEILADTSQPILNFRVAGWYWTVYKDYKHLNAIADSLTTTDPSKPDFLNAVWNVNLAVSKAVNGINKKTGLPNGLQERYTAFALAVEILFGYK